MCKEYDYYMCVVKVYKKMLIFHVISMKIILLKPFMEFADNVDFIFFGSDGI